MTLYLSSVSFEDRCLALTKSLGSPEVGDRVVLLDFSGYENVSPYVFNRYSLLKILAGKHFDVEIIETAPGHPLAILPKVHELLLRLAPQRVVVDISVLPKSFLFVMLRCLRQASIPTTLCYYRPLNYGSELSHGVRAIHAIPGFEGNIEPGSELILAIILGFEGYKALAAWERIGPSKVIALIGDPPYRPEFINISKQNNKELLERTERLCEKSLHTYDVLLAKKQLEVLYQSVVHEGMSFVICPLGTKIQSLAAFAFASENQSVGVAYVSSLRYYTEEYSRGWQPEVYEVELAELLRGGEAVVGGEAR